MEIWKSNAFNQDSISVYNFVHLQFVIFNRI